MEAATHKINQAEEIFFNGSSYFAGLVDAIERAKSTIDLETYMFKYDALGKKVIQALRDAAERHVKVRVLVDGAGTPSWGGEAARSLEKSGAETRVFHPFPWQLWQWSRSRVRVPFLLKAIYLFLKINSRNHRKSCLIDKSSAFIGSFNIDQRHLTRDHAGEEWRDTGIKLSKIDLTPLSVAFDNAWDHAVTHDRLRQIFRHVQKNPIIRLNYSWIRRRILYKNLLRRIKKCKKRIWITNAYFVPDNFLLRNLIDAAKRGLDVRILLPRKSDVLFMPLASATFFNILIKAGVRVFEYLPSVLHAKTLILDDWMSVGSSNLNHRSLLHDLEVDINVRQVSSKKALQEQFLLDLEQAKEIALNHWQKHTAYQRLLGRIALYSKYLI